MAGVEANRRRGARGEAAASTVARTGRSRAAALPLLAASLLVSLGVVSAFPIIPSHRHVAIRGIVAPTSTARFAGGGFGVKSKSTEKKKTAKKKKKPRSGLLGASTDLPSAEAAAPRLDRFGLPPPTEEDVFPPLGPEVVLAPAEYDGGSEYSFDRDGIAEATKDHLGVNLASSAFETNDDCEPAWKIRLLHRDPPVLAVDGFFTEDECREYMTLTESDDKVAVDGGGARPRAVRIASPTFSASAISRRTSTTWFCRYEGATAFLAKARELLGVEIGRMEEPQVVRYRTGEEFSWHYDEVPQTQLANGGQRLATLLVYLNGMDEGRGGGTVFRDLEAPRVRGKKGKGKSKREDRGGAERSLTVRPRAGTALLFFPARGDGTPDERMLHKGEVALDTKVIAQLWVHEGEYRAGVPEGNLQADAAEGVEEEARRLGFS